MPGVPASAMQRGVLLEVPFMATSCRRSVSVSSTGTVPVLQAVVSDQWKAIRYEAQHTPQPMHAFAMMKHPLDKPLMRADASPGGGVRATLRAQCGRKYTGPHCTRKDACEKFCFAAFW